MTGPRAPVTILLEQSPNFSPHPMGFYLCPNFCPGPCHLSGFPAILAFFVFFAVYNLLSNVVIKTTVGGKGIFHLTILRSVRAGTPRRNAEPELGRNHGRMKAASLVLSLLSAFYTSQDHGPKDGITSSRPGLPTSIINQNNTPRLLYRPV